MDRAEKLRIADALIEAGKKLRREVDNEIMVEAIIRLSETAPRHWI